MNIADTVKLITGTDDGPVTSFVVISRAMDLVDEGVVSAETAANALYNVLSTMGLEPS